MNDGDAIGQDTPVQRLYRRLVGLAQPMSGLTDAERAGRGDRIASAVTGMVRLPADSLGDVGCKLAVVGDRLRTEDHTACSPFGALTILLLDSARDDLVRLAILTAEPGDGTDA